MNPIRSIRSLATPLERLSYRSFSSTKLNLDLSGAEVESFLTKFNIKPNNVNSYIAGLTHKTYKHGSVDNSDRFQLIGEKFFNTIITEQFLTKFNCSEKMLKQVLISLFSKEQIFKTLEPLEFEKVCQFELLKENKDKPLPKFVLVKQKNAIINTCYNGLLGAIYYDQGWAAAKQFLNDTLLNKEFNVEHLKAFDNPEKSVKDILSAKGLPEPIVEVIPREDGLYLATLSIASEKVSSAVGYKPLAATYRAYANLLSNKFQEDIKLLKL